MTGEPRSFMLTVFTRGLGARDVRVDNAGGILEAIAVAEKVTGAPVHHGRGGVGSLFDPAVVIDAASGEVDNRHDRAARDSMVPVKSRVRYPRPPAAAGGRHD